MKSIKSILKKSNTLTSMYRSIRDRSPLRRNVEFRNHLECKFNGTPSMETGTFEPIETFIFKNNIDNFDLFINVGANMGYYSVMALSRKKQVVAFEPNSTNLEILYKNITANRFERNCEIHPIALCNTIGIMPMYGSNTGASLIKGWAGQHTSTLVPTNKLDNILAERVKNQKIFILMDIEGAEYECLLGATKLLTTNTPLLLFVEISVSEHQPAGTVINPNLTKTFKLLYEMGYKCISIGNTRKEVFLEQIEQIEKTMNDTLETHNFIFFNKHIDKNNLML